MNGARSLVETLVNSGVEVCFSNPGTSEMHFVAALDKVEGMRGVLALFEGVATGAADGYGRMADKPACTLLHLGPGLANGLANLHNAKKAFTPVVNVVGEHATYHKALNAPLTSDIEGLSAPMSKWVCTSPDAKSVAGDAAEAVRQAMSGEQGVATLILPANTAWDESNGPVAALPIEGPMAPDGDAVNAAAKALEKSGRKVMLMNGNALRAKGLEAAARIQAKTGVEIFVDTFYPRSERGEGIPIFPNLPYFPDDIAKAMEGASELILVGSPRPVTFFAYPGKKSDCTPEGVEPVVLATRAHDGVAALEALADAVNAPAIDKLEKDPRVALSLPDLPTGELSSGPMGQTIAALLPENAILSSEAATSGLAMSIFTAASRRHDWLNLSGGSIGQGLPVAVGAAVACPDRKTVCVSGDGGAMYTIQSLWTMARENLDVTTVICANRSYAILNIELMNVGAENAGPKALSMLNIGSPDLSFTEIARGMGVEAMRSETAEDFNDHFKYCMENKGPKLIEVML
ncbi:MAG: acetolactate synthase large subunit [Alphaproteobacteria bacterium]|nr:MAG: acetolactate synthase large subunit [Alphaproteobacteria bacterium]